MHFNDKDELLVSGIHDMLRSVCDAESPPSGKLDERLIRFSLPIFEHIHQHRLAGAAKMGARGRAIIHEHLQKVLAELIADEVRKEFHSHRKTPGRIPPDLLVQYLASTFILVLNWCVESKNPVPAREINEVFLCTGTTDAGCGESMSV